MKNWLKKEKALKWLCVALILILISGIGASAMESSGGRVEVRDYRLTWAQMATEITENARAYGKDVVVTFDGSNGSTDLSASNDRLSFKLLVPETATEETPAPAVVTTHGFYNNKEMQDAYYVELARRGFVVISLDSPGHGGSDPNFAANADIMKAVENTGAEACVEWLASQPYVDEDRIGLTGHSMGTIGNAYAIINLANAGHADYVKSNLAQAQANSLPMIPEALGAVPEGMQNGIIAARYDEFGMIRDDTYNYPTSSNCIDIIRMAYPGFDESSVEMGTWYTAQGAQQVNITKGKTINETASIAYWLDATHPLTHFSTEAVGYAVDFFYTTLGVPAGNSYIAPENSWHWFVKELFNLVGLVGFFLLIVPVGTLLLRVPVFKKLVRTADDNPNSGLLALGSFRTTGQKALVLTMGAVVAIVTAFMLEPLYIDPRLGNYIFPTTNRYPQPTTNTIALWVVLCGLVTIAAMLLIFAVRIALWKKDKTTNPFAPAALSGVSDFLRAMLYGAVTVSLLYLVVWLQYTVWGTDFRFWTLAVLKFDFSMIPAMLRYLPFFLFFFVVNAVSNVNNRFRELPDWASMILVCLFNVGGYLLVWVLQYSTMITTGDYSYVLVSDHSHAMFGSLAPLLMIPIFVTLIVANLVTRKIYKRTGNIWAAASINAILNTVMIVANTFTQLPYTIA